MELFILLEEFAQLIKSTYSRQCLGKTKKKEATYIICFLSLLE